MDVGSLRSRRFPARWLTAARGTRQSHGWRLLACASSRSALSKVRSRPRFSKCSPSQWHNSVGFREVAVAASPGSVVANRLEHQARGSRFASHSVTFRLARHCVCVPRWRGNWSTHAGAHRKEDWSYAAGFVKIRNHPRFRRSPSPAARLRRARNARLGDGSVKTRRRSRAAGANIQTRRKVALAWTKSPSVAWTMFDRPHNLNPRLTRNSFISQKSQALA